MARPTVPVIHIGGRRGYRMILTPGPDPDEPEKGATWWWKVLDTDGREVKRSRKSRTLTEAQEACSAVMRQLERGDTRAADPTLRDIIDEYLDFRDEQLDKLRADKTLVLSRQEAALIPDTVMSKKVSELKKKQFVEMDRALNAEGYAARTRSKVVILIRSAWRYGVGEETVQVPCPIDGYIVTVPQKEADPLTPPQELAFWNTAVAHAEASPSWSEARRDLVAISLMLFQGYRIGESVAARPCDVVDGTITMAGHVVKGDDGLKWVPGSKTGPVRTIPLMGPAKTLVEQAVADAPDPYGPLLPTRGGGWMDLDNLRRTCDNIVKKVNDNADDDDPSRPRIEGFKPHRLRDTFGTRMGAAGTEVRTLSALMGHAGPSMTYKYVKVLQPGMLDAAAAYEANNPHVDVPPVDVVDEHSEAAG